jgi:hypothetical protein
VTSISTATRQALQQAALMVECEGGRVLQSTYPAGGSEPAAVRLRALPEPMWFIQTTL